MPPNSAIGTFERKDTNRFSDGSYTKSTRVHTHRGLIRGLPSTPASTAYDSRPQRPSASWIPPNSAIGTFKRKDRNRFSIFEYTIGLKFGLGKRCRLNTTLARSGPAPLGFPRTQRSEPKTHTNKFSDGSYTKSTRAHTHRELIWVNPRLTP